MSWVSTIEKESSFRRLSMESHPAAWTRNSFSASAESSTDNALSQSRQFWLDQKAALAHAADVARVVDGWRAHFEQAGVPAAVIEQLGAAIDRPFLREQREKLMRVGR